MKQVTRATVREAGDELTIAADLALAAVKGAALALAPEQVRRVGMDGSLALYNARVGLRSVLSEHSRVRDELPRIKLDALRLVETLALAYGAASRRVQGGTENVRAFVGRAPQKGPEAMRDARDLRNRVGTLLLSRWADLWRAGSYLFGPEAVEERVPLLSRRLAPRKAAMLSG